MTVLFQTFIDRLGGAKDGDELSQAMTRFAEACGLSTFTYLDFRQPGSHPPVYLTTYPKAWIYHYASRRYQEIDPVIVQSRYSVRPFFWDDRSPDAEPNPEQTRLFGEAAEFGIRCGFTVPVHEGREGLAMVSFSSDRNAAQARRDVIAYRQLLQLASMYFHVHARQCLRDSIAADLSLLDAQEAASLQWVARGKSVWDIGEILGVSRDVVLCHLANAKRKLRALSLSHAVAIALYYKVIEV